MSQVASELIEACDSVGVELAAGGASRDKASRPCPRLSGSSDGADRVNSVAPTTVRTPMANNGDVSTINPAGARARQR